MPELQELQDSLAQGIADVRAIGEKMKNDQANAVKRDELEKALAAATASANAVDELERKFLAQSSRQIITDPSEQKLSTIRGESKMLGDYFKSGRLSDESRQAMTLAMGTDNSTGHYVVMPAAMATDIMGLLRDVSPMEQICDVQTIDGTSWEQVKVTAGGSAGRVAERGTRSETNTPTFGKLKIDCHGYYAYPTVTQEQLYMANAVDLGAFVMNDANLEIQELVEADYLTGTGVGCPFGLLANSTLTGAATVTGNASTLKDFDAFRTITGAIHDTFLGGAQWMMKRATEVAMALLKDGTGNYLLQGVAAGVPTSLMGYPIRYNGYMPAIGAGTYPVAFGNFQQGYSIRISRFMLLIRDEITSPGYVKMYKEIKKGGDVKRTDALALLKVAAA